MLEKSIAKDGTLDSKLLDELYYEILDLSGLVVEYFQLNKKKNIKELGPQLMGFYTIECNRMTTGIMQAMSWCLMQKGVRSGEVTAEEASDKHSRLTNTDLFNEPIGCDTEKFPRDFLMYSGRARSLYEKIVRLDRILYETPDRGENPVQGLLDKIEEL